MPQLPSVHQLVTIRDLLGRESASRVEDVADPLLMLARPLDLLVEHEFGIGDPVLVSWPNPHGIATATTELIESRVRGPLGLWVVEMIGELRVEQRRQFVRVPAAGRVQLQVPAEPDTEAGDIETGDTETGDTGTGDAKPAGQDEPVELSGWLCSVSEGALRCAFDREQAALLAPDRYLTVAFEFAREAYRLPAQLLRLEPSNRDRDRVEAILLLQVGENSAATLRRSVFAEQLRIRNSG